MIGHLEYVKLLTGPHAGEAAYAVLRSEDRRRYFIPPIEAPAGLALGDRVSFDADDAGDPKGPCARRVQVIARSTSAAPAASAILADIAIVCTACRASFVWTRGEQISFRDRNFAAPRRCRSCRAARASTRG